VGLTALVNLSMLLIGCGALMSVTSIIVQAFGLAQLVWMIPLWKAAKKYGGSETAKGVLLGIGITFLLSVACWTVVIPGFRR
ncbi:MAG: hypothetical protein KGN36_07420, partial [Acidobacteriota bacterium]|nr:hypothetical protein [Acidobacteriota bacterium]